MSYDAASDGPVIRDAALWSMARWHAGFCDLRNYLRDVWGAPFLLLYGVYRIACFMILGNPVIWTALSQHGGLADKAMIIG